MAVYTGIFSLRIRFDIGVIAKNRASITVKGGRAFRELQRRSYELAREAWVLGGRPTVEHPVGVEYHIYRGRVLDRDGATAGLSRLRDALFVDAITPSDSDTWIAQEKIHWETGQEWKGREEVVVVVVPLTDLPKPKVRERTPKDDADDEKALQEKALRQALRGR